ncbi:hypothetical protein M8013_20720 [Enterobacteriaceae bacterium H4N4]|uniref:Uncharacterized protein n=1 Tax=Silvania confinis TaxID=2926470 RepID=A0A9J6QLH5_9ENTR|nr:hypothetical protein [Silvania confinis]MCU6671155.1 hypothetical protein [Silvania confinis]
MKKVIVFFNSQSAEVVRTLEGVTAIKRNYPNGEEVHLPISLAGIHSVTGDQIEIYVASDRELCLGEVENAVNNFLKES